MMDHENRLQRALSLAASATPPRHLSLRQFERKPTTTTPTAAASGSMSTKLVRQSKNRQLRVAKAHVATPKPKRGGCVRALALGPSLLLPEERNSSAPTRLVLPLPPPSSSSSSSSLLPSASPRKKSVHFSDNELVGSCSDTENQMQYAEYSVYPAWWGHEEHVPSIQRERRPKKHSLNKKKTTVAAVEGNRARTTFAAAANHVSVAVGADFVEQGDSSSLNEDNYASSSSDSGRERTESENEPESQHPVYRAVRQKREWIRKEEPIIQNWKFPKQLVDESVQVSLPLNATRENSNAKPAKHRSQYANVSDDTDTRYATESSPPARHYRRSESDTDPAPTDAAPGLETNKFLHFTVPVHDLAPGSAKPRKKRGGNPKSKANTAEDRGRGNNSFEKRNKVATEELTSRPGGMVGAANTESPGTRGDGAEKGSVLDIVFAFLGDEKVMSALDLNVLEEESLDVVDQ